MVIAVNPDEYRQARQTIIRKYIAIQSPALQARSTSGMVGAYLCSTEHSASWEFSIHSSGSSKRDVVHLTVSSSESDPEESDTAV